MQVPPPPGTGRRTAEPRRGVDDDDARAPFSSFHRAGEAGRAGADDDDIRPAPGSLIGPVPPSGRWHGHHRLLTYDLTSQTWTMIVKET